MLNKQGFDAITHKIAQRVSRYLEQAGYLVRDVESAYLDLQTDDDDAMATIVGASISYRLAFGPNAGLGAPAETNDLKDHAFNRDDIETYRTGQ